MGLSSWIWSPSSSSSSSSSSDPVKRLDPSLREFLEKESPKPHTSPPAKEETSWLKEAESKIPQSSSPAPSTQSAEVAEDKPAVPPESLFPDGRYAHIWKHYKPLHEVEDATKTTQDRLHDIYDVHHARKSSTATAARENCVFYELAYQDCLSSTSWNSKLFMCTTENRALSRCVDMQMKFLKALGYMSVVGTGSVEDEERIQMHADRLYQRMIEQEKLREEARKAGREPPPFEPVLSPKNINAAMAASTESPAAVDPFDPSDIPHAYHEKFVKDIKGKSSEEATLWKASLKQELKQRSEYARKYKEALDLEKEQRAQRFERGAPTIGDRLKRMLGWDHAELIVVGVNDPPKAKETNPKDEK